MIVFLEIQEETSIPVDIVLVSWKTTLIHMDVMKAPVVAKLRPKQVDAGFVLDTLVETGSSSSKVSFFSPGLSCRKIFPVWKSNVPSRRR
jgi:hypothetical protein